MPHQKLDDDQDPFVVGQFIGMLTMLTYIEEHNGIQKDFLKSVKEACAEKASQALGQPTEDIYLMADALVENIGPK